MNVKVYQGVMPKSTGIEISLNIVWKFHSNQ